MALITRLAIFSFTVACSNASRAQELGAGAVAAALAHSNSSVVAAPFESTNPAGIGGPDRVSAAFSVEQGYAMTELRYATAGVMLPLRRVGIGVAAESFGFSDYRRITASVVVSAPVATRGHLGARLSYRHVGVSGYSSDGAFGLSIGWLADIHRSAAVGGAWRYVGASVRSPKVLLAQEVLIGVRLEPAEHLRIFGSVAQEFEMSPDLRLGSEITLSRQILVRIGTGTNPERVAFGVGIRLGTVRTDLGVGLHPILGRSVSTTVGLQ